MNKNKKIYVIFVNWNNSLMTINAINSFRNNSSFNAQIIVVDNGSTDNSCNIILNSNISNLILLQSKINSGFGSGCNIGIKYALDNNADYILLLNNDVIVHNDILYYFLNKINNLNNVGAVAGILIDKNKIYRNHSGYYLNPITFSSIPCSSEDIINSRKYSWFTAACVLIPSNVFRNVGFFDENFFMYWEDFDLFHRIKSKGFKLYISHQVTVSHSPGSSSNNLVYRRYEWHLYSGKYWIYKNFKFKFYAVAVLALRSFIKSIIKLDLIRFNISVKFIRELFNDY